MRNLAKKEKKAREMLCIPLDGVSSLSEIQAIVKELSLYAKIFKIGKETFTRFGPEAVKTVKSMGADVFLDLKYHDIPNTVKGAAKAACELDIYMLNVHSTGGIEMMKAAKDGVMDAVKKGHKKPKIVAVTILTSIDKKMMNQELGIKGSVESKVLALAKLAEKAKLDGIVCSAADLKKIKRKLPKNFIYVTPGIKGPKTDAGSDQKRIYTPYNAIKDGAKILVVGRAITGAKNRQKACLEVLEDMAKAI